ncbi:MAG: DUF2442 domain-containing protein [Candidatus Acidiferrales bacterium]
MSKEAHKIKVSSEHLDAAMTRARRFEADDRRVTSAWYEPAEDLVGLSFADGLKISIPRKQLQGLDGATRTKLSKIEIVGHGTGLHWPRLGVDHYVLGLLDQKFGTKRWMEEIGRRGGSAKSAAKAKAARRNGQRGGRPRSEPIQSTHQ